MMNNQIKIAVLGGQEEIGLNSTVVETANEVMIIDLGINFEDSEFGVDYYIPNIDLLLPKIEKIKGLLITHGHYDHRAAIPFLIDKLGNPPIYGSPFTIQLIKQQLKEFRKRKAIRFIPLNPRQEISLGTTKVKAIRLTHSIVGSYGYLLKTPLGNLFHTGDFKFDQKPFNENPSDLQSLRQAGKEGVLVAMIDSTRANREDHSRSETDITQNLEKLIKNAPGRIIVSTFAQMLNRIYQIALIGKKYQRQIFIKGRTLEKTTRIGKEMGILGKEIKIQTAEKMANYPDSQILLFATGSQGEERAALQKMLTAKSGVLKISAKDTIILSSSNIPSNLVAIQKLVDDFADRGCRVFTDDIIDIHAGGHAHQQEIKQMLDFLKPQYVFPIEGYISLRHRLAQLAHSLGYSKKRVILAKNGEPVIINKGGYQKLKKEFKDPQVVIDNKIIKNGAEIISQRKKAAEKGLVIVLLAKKRSPKIFSWGVPDFIVNQIKKDLRQKKISSRDPQQVKKIIKKMLRFSFPEALLPAIRVEFF
jgi:ribonuclease J